MRNLKRALSLALASVMLLGMMVVGTGASYADVTSEHNEEAIAEMQAVGVMSGDTNGKFNPDQKVTRGEMAVVMTNLLGLNVNDYAGTTLTFTDVPDWGKGFVAACVANGIAAGYNEKQFGFNDSVTTAQAALMMMKALGYFQFAPDFGQDWQVATVKQGSKISLFDGVKAGASTAMTRNDVAQIALNTLKADMVDYTGSQGTNITLPDGSSIVTGYTIQYNARTDTNSRDYSVQSEGDSTLQLAEYLYDSNLRMDSQGNDDMRRPATTWTYKGDTFGTYANEADYTVVVDKAQTAAKEIEDINKNFTFASNPVTVNGAAGVAQSTALKVGDIVQVYMNENNTKQVDTIAVTRYSAAQLTGNVSTKGEGEDLEVRIPGVFSGYKSADDVLGYADLTKNDVVYYYVDNQGVYHLAKAASFEGQLTGIKTGTPNKYIISGTDYVANGNVAIADVTTSPVYNTTYAYYTDNNGYLIFAEEIEDASSDYVVIQQIVYVPGDGSINGSDRVEARIVKMDGTTEVVKIASIQNGTGAANLYTGISTTDTTGNNGSNKYLVYDTNGGTAGGVDLAAAITGLTDKAFFTYSINSDKEYELTKVVADAADKITIGTITAAGVVDNGKVSITGTGNATTANNNTVFVVAKESGKDKFATYTGISAVPDLTGATLTWVAKNGVATYVYVDSYNTSTVSGDTVFIMDATKESFTSEKDGSTTTYYNTYKAIVNGQSTTVKVKAAANGDNSLDGGSDSVAVGLFKPTYNSDGLITKLVSDNTLGQTVENGYQLSDGALVAGGTAGYSYSDDALVFIMDEDGDVTKAVASDLTEDDNDSIYVVTTNGTDKVVDYLFIIEKDDSDVSLATLTCDNSITLNKDAVTQSVTSATGTQYTVSATANGQGSTVKFSQTNNGSDWAAANGTVNKVTGPAAGSSANLYILVESVDGTQQVYTITFTTPAP